MHLLMDNNFKSSDALESPILDEQALKSHAQEVDQPGKISDARKSHDYEESK